MGAQSSLLTLVGAASVGANKIAESASRLSKDAPEAPQAKGSQQNGKKKIAQALDPEKNINGAVTAEQVKNTLRKINAANKGINQNLKTRLEAKEMMRMR